MPDRVHLTATFKVKPGSEGKVLELLKEAQSETRKEKGCLKYDLIQDLTETNVFVSSPFSALSPSTLRVPPLLPLSP